MRTPHIAVLLGAGALALRLSGCNSVDNPIASGPPHRSRSTARTCRSRIRVSAARSATDACTLRSAPIQGTSGVAAVVTEGDNPTVVSVGLGNVNGVTLGYLSNLPMGGGASVKKILRTYTITGQATGINISNPPAARSQELRVQVRCP